MHGFLSAMLKVMKSCRNVSLPHTATKRCLPDVSSPSECQLMGTMVLVLAEKLFCGLSM